jgi:O-antigen ligase
VTASIGRVSEVLRLETRSAWLLIVASLAALGLLVGAATRLGALPAVVAVSIAGVATIVSLRWPLLPLMAFVALIPIEEIIVIDGLGTLSRFAGILFAVSYGVHRFRVLSPRLMPPAAWAYLAWALLSLGWAISPATAWAQIPTLVQLFLIAALVADVVVQQPAMVRRLMWVYSLSASATAVVGIQVFLGLGPGRGLRASAIGGQDPAQFAAVLLPALVFGLYELLNGDRPLVGGAIALMTTAGIVVSGTRGAWLSVVVVVLLFVLPRLSFRRRLIAMTAVVVIAIATVQIPGVSSLLTQRAGNAISSGGAGRTDIWAVGVTLFKSVPIAGVGYANFPVANTEDAIRAAAVNDRHLGSGPHNLVVGTAVELGSIGLLILALFLLPLVLRRGWGPDAATVQAALASLLIAALFVDLLSDRKQVWLMIGFAAGLALVERRRSALPPDWDLSGGEAAGHLGSAHKADIPVSAVVVAAAPGT